MEALKSNSTLRKKAFPSRWSMYGSGFINIDQSLHLET